MMVVKRALLTLRDFRTQSLSLIQVERTVYHWITEDTGRHFNGVDYVTEDDAVRQLRLLIEGEPLIYSDLTIFPVAPPAEVRAARACREILYCDENAEDQMVQAIRQHTAIDKLVESVNLLLTYEIPRLRGKKPAGLDITHAGLIVAVLEALEIAQQQDLGRLKSMLTEGIERIVPALPVERKPS